MTDPTREAFEAWARTQTNRIDALNRKGDGYVITTAQIMWLAWQAALAQQGREVVTEKVTCVDCGGKGYTDEGDPEIGSALVGCETCDGTGYIAAPKQQAVDEAMLSHIAAVIDGTLATCVSDSTTEERMYAGDQCLNELANIRAALAALPGKTEVVTTSAEALMALTEKLTEHPEGWEGPCWCATCRSYATDDDALPGEAQS